MAERDPDPEAYLTVKQAAAYLHLNEKKIYALIQEGRMPATKATGKWLFPKRLLDEWLTETAHGGALADRLIIGGSDDPLLAHAVASFAQHVAEEAIVAYCPGGTRVGLTQLARRRANVAAIHWGEAAQAGLLHQRLIEEYPGHDEWVLVRFAERRQGIMLRPGLGHGDAPSSLAGRELRWLRRAPGAGSQHFFEARLASHGLAPRYTLAASSERHAAYLISRGLADCGPGAEAAAAEFGLGFLPLGTEAFDFVLPRPVFFRTLFQRLLEHLASGEIRELAERLGGYDLTELGKLRLQGR